MAVYTGKVVNGVVTVSGVLLPEGTKVTLLVDDEEDSFHLTPDMIAELDESIAQMERGEGIPVEQVLAELRDKRRPRRVEVSS